MQSECEACRADVGPDVAILKECNFRVHIARVRTVCEVCRHLAVRFEVHLVEWSVFPEVCPCVAKIVWDTKKLVDGRHSRKGLGADF